MGKQHSGWHGRPPAMVARFDQLWARLNADLAGLIEQAQAHDQRCDGPVWCMDARLHENIEAMTCATHKMMLWAAVIRLAIPPETGPDERY